MYYIIPEPKKMISQTGSFILPYNVEIALSHDCGDDERYYAGLLKEEIENRLGFWPVIQKSFLKDDDYSFPGSRILLRNGCTDMGPAAKDEGAKWEGYRLKISPEGIVIAARNKKGILYGVQSLRQLISQEGAVLPCLTIEDAPDIPNRGFYHDAGRGRIQTLDSYKRFADMLSYYKINQMQLYMEHSFCFRELSEVWRDDTPITAEEILELDEYCRKLQIDLVPSLATFGHLYKVMQTKSFSRLCELEGSYSQQFSFIKRMQHHTLNVTDEEARELIKKMLDEFIPLFRSEYFNICADETFDLGKGRSKSKALEVGVHRLYMEHVKDLCAHVKKHGKHPMLWGDIILGCPEMIKELPEDAICLNWGYGDNESDENAKKMKAAGATQYLCPGVHGWNHFINRLDFAYENISRMCRYAIENGAIGVLNTDWGDFGHVADPEFSIPGMIYGAALSWNSDQQTEEQINKRISRVEFADGSERIVSLLRDLARQEGFSWEQAIRYMEIEEDGTGVDGMTEIFRGFGIGNITAANEGIEACCEDLYSLIIGTDTKLRKRLAKYLVHARGQLLFNQVAVVLGVVRHGMAKEAFIQASENQKMKTDMLSEDSYDPMILAGMLESWFMEYKKVWRDSCKESELYRIQNVIFWFADLLRTLAE